MGCQQLVQFFTEHATLVADRYRYVLESDIQASEFVQQIGVGLCRSCGFQQAGDRSDGGDEGYGRKRTRARTS